MMSASKKKILITGVSGLLGSNLAYCLRDDYDICGLYFAHAISMQGVLTRQCDIREKDQIGQVIGEFAPDIVIHCAAQARVDRCEEDPVEARRINVTATENIAGCLSGASTKLVYISTDLVYDGDKGSFTEEDPIGPRNIYAQTKVEAEEEALKFPGALVLRINIFGWNVFDFESLAEWAANNVSAGKEIKGFHDAVFSSIYTFDLAKFLVQALEKDLTGIYNLGSKNSISKYDFAVTVARQLGLDEKFIVPVSIDSFGFKAKRSKNLSLDISKFEKAVGVSGVTIEESIMHFAQDYKNGMPAKFKSFGKQKVKHEI